MTSGTKSNSSVVAMPEVRHNGKQVIVPVAVGGFGFQNGIQMDVNTISSVYEKSVKSLVTEAIAQENAGDIGIFYAKKEAMTLPGAGVQFPAQLQQSIASNGIIHRFSEKVNMNILEMVCDAMGEMNAFATEETSSVAGEVGQFLRDLRKAALETQTKGQKNNAPEGVKHSREMDGYDYTKSFEQQLEDYNNKEFPKTDALVLGGTPEVLREIGLAGIPLVINQQHVNAALNGNYRGTQQEILDYSFTISEFSKLPEKIADPVAVIQDKRTGKAAASESVVDVIVEMTAKSGKQVLCAVQIGSSGHINGIRVDANKVATVHGNTDTVTRLVDAINEHTTDSASVYYVNKGKTTNAIQRAGNPIPGGLNDLDGFTASISE